jgi:polar amino acid transport system substrate-binding protein
MKYVLKLLAAVALAAAAAVTGGAATAQSTWDAIQERGTLRIGVTQSPPWFTQDPATGEWNSGLGISLGKGMAEVLGVELETVDVTWGTAIAALQADQIDIMYILDATPSRAMTVDFPSNPLAFISLAVLAKEDIDVSTWEAMNRSDFAIAVPQGTSMDAFLTKNLPEADIQRFPDNGAAIAAYQSGRVDAVSLFHPPLLAARQRLGSGQLVVPKPSYSSPTSAAVRREDDKTFLNWVDLTLLYWYETGQTEAWYEEFLVEFGLDPKESPVIQRELLLQ